ncbi:MAG: chorismate mutase, partial [Clostridia bacterium]
IANEGKLSKIELQRKKIDEIDEKMTQLYVERMQCAKQIGLEKAKTDESVFVGARENEILNKVASSVPEDLVEQTKQFYNTIFETSKNYQSTSIKNLNKKD